MQVLLNQWFKLIPLYCFLVVMQSCERLQPIEGPVSFVHLPAFELLDNPEINEFGLQEKITDAWVFQDGQNIGVYELPITLPIFKEGATDFRIFPGILEDGSSLKRERHPFLLAFDTSIALKGNDTIEFIPRTEYDTLTTFPFSEQFEAGNSIEGVGVTTNPSIVLDGGRSGEWLVNDPTSVSQAKFPLISLPNDSRPIIFELNYKNSVPFDVFMKEYREGIEYYIVTISTKEEWNTLYVNLTPAATLSQADQYQIILRAPATEDGQAQSIYLDNLKIMHR